MTAAAADETLDEFAAVLAHALEDARVRHAVHDAESERFDGAPEVLLKHLRGRTVSGRTFRDAVVAAIRESRGASPAKARETFRRIAKLSPRLQIAVPVHLDEWDPDTFTPPVTIASEGVREEDYETLILYGTSGAVEYADADVVPDHPVIVVGLNERTDAQGAVLSAFRGLEGRTSQLGSALP